MSSLPPAGLRPPVLASSRFREHAPHLCNYDRAEVFTFIYETNLWGSSESPSGEGSEFLATETLRTEIPRLMRRLGVRRLLDAPCGDFGWMSKVDLSGIEYLGLDLVQAIVDNNQREHQGRLRRFQCLDIVRDPLPQADIILCRDCLVHLTYKEAREALSNMKESGSTFLLTTTFTQIDRNVDIQTGDWRPLNLMLEPFNFPPPLDLVNERCEEGDGAYADKSLGLWRLSDLLVSSFRR
ncbi:class I SAM-dependent methyltransferase [Sphaerisporangium dianthi]|uniref:Class I SAM-dependent methyltransferase n=1 Tax=Sphaerisporangium dianthi TaxID=1436120 RepID=A0ABV9CF43_9ACTN